MAALVSATFIELIKLSRDLGRPRYDLWEILIWAGSANVDGKEVFHMQGVHKADIILENVDCVLAVMETEKDPWKSN